MAKKAFIIILILCFSAAFVNSQTDSASIKKVNLLYDEFLNLLNDVPDSAIFILDSMEKVATDADYKQGIALALRERGMYHSQTGDYVKAMALMDSALHIDEKIDYKEGIASDLLFLGMNFFDQGKTVEALDYLPRARDIYMEMNDFEGVALISGNLGSVYRNLDQFDKALEQYKYSYDFYLKQGNEAKRASAENNIGNLYKDLKQYDLALEYLFRSKELKTKYNMSYSMVPTLSNIADIYQIQGRVNEAIDYYLQALQIANKHNASLFRKDIFLDLSRAYEKKGDKSKALEYFKNYSKLKDTILSVDFNKELAKMKIRYESEKLEKEKLFLSKENEIEKAHSQKEEKWKIIFAVLAGLVFIAALFIFVQYRNKQKLNAQLELINKKVNNQNTTLKQLNKELIDSEERLLQSIQSKDQLISMISHDLFNPVMAIRNYTKQICDESEKMSQTELNAAIIKINNAIIPLKDLLDNILQWAQLQKKNIAVVTESTDINNIIDEIIKLYQPGAAFKDVTINAELSDNVVANIDKMMIHFVLRNILNNAVKFSQPKTSIFIETKISENNILIVVKDEGIGFDHDVLTALNSNYQKDVVIASSGSGVGLNASRQFIQLLNWNISFDNRVNGGAIVKVTIPIG